MSTISTKAADALLNYKKLNSSNTKVWQDYDGSHMAIFGNKIAWVTLKGELWIDACGWVSKTTRDRLNEVLGGGLSIKKKEYYLDGEVWDGKPRMIRVQVEKPSADQGLKSTSFIETTSWVSYDGWRGANVPTFAVAGANDTGTWDDSPCPTPVANKELSELASYLLSQGVPTKEMVCTGSNVFCAHRYLITYPRDTEYARVLVDSYLQKNETQLLYLVK
jgi:hypothetical protein